MFNYRYKENCLYCGDNRKVLRYFPDECVDLIYIDPPFFSGRNYDLVFEDKFAMKAFDDTFEHNMETYMDFMEEIIRELKRVLKPTGSFYLHCDYHANAHLRIMCDRIFGKNNFKTSITWRRSRPKGNSKGFSNTTDTILYYTKSDTFTFNKIYASLSQGSLKRYNKEDKNGRYMELTITAPGSDNIWDFGIGETLPSLGRGYAWNKEKIQNAINTGELSKSKKGYLVRKRYLSESKGVPLTDLWNDIHHVQGSERYGYPTQKPEALLERIIKISSNEKDIVLDAFCGCGTALAVAQKLNRKYIGIDVSPIGNLIVAARLRPKYSLNEIQGMKWTLKRAKEMSWMAFQIWTIKAIGGDPNTKKGGDQGIDGWHKENKFDQIVPIQVKQSENGIGVKDVREFNTVIRREKKKGGFILGIKTTKGARAEAYRIKKDDDITIELITVDDILSINGTLDKKVGEPLGMMRP